MKARRRDGSLARVGSAAAAARAKTRARSRRTPRARVDMGGGEDGGDGGEDGDASDASDGARIAVASRARGPDTARISDR